MGTTTLAAGLLIVAGSTALAIAGLFAVARWLPQLRRPEDEGAKGVFFSMVGVLYAVLLAFVVVLVWSDFVDAGNTTQTEVSRISNLARDAAVFPEVETFRIRQRLVAYSRAVATSEWDAMAKGESSPVAQRAYEAVWSEYYRFTPETDKEKTFYSESVGRLNELGESRRQRLLASQSTVPGLMWLLLLVGFAVTTWWTYVFKMTTMAFDALAVGSIAALTGFVLFLILALQHPFAGDVKISAEPYLQVAKQYAPGG